MGNGISETGALTTIQLSIIAVFAILVVIGMLYGARLKARRNEAKRIEDERVEAESTSGEDAASPQAPQSVADAPPPNSRRSVEPAPPADDPPAAAAFDDGAPAIASDPASSVSNPADRPITQLKGLGPKVATRLAELGITTVGQIAALDAGAADALDAQLGTFRGRMARDRWVEQARLLAAGDKAGFEAVFGRL